MTGSMFTLSSTTMEKNQPLISRNGEVYASPIIVNTAVPKNESNRNDPQWIDVPTVSRQISEA